MKRFLGWGSVGDTYIITCKLLKIKDRVVMHHYTRQTHWYRTIMDIYKLAKNVMEVRFLEEPRTDLIELTTDSHEQEMEFFPTWGIVEKVKRIEKPYTVVQAHSGKLVGGNAKYIPRYALEDIILSNDKKCVLLGTHAGYGQIGNCVNLINRTTVFDVIEIVSNADNFIGPEGFLSFVALSQKVPSRIYYTDFRALERRVVGTLWEEFAEDYIDMRNLWV